MPSRALIRLLALVATVLLLCSACWVNLATKHYPSDLRVVHSVEQWRSDVSDALRAEGLNTEYHLPIALVTMACESKGDPDTPNGGLYQFTRHTWSSTSQSHRSRYDPDANITAMAETVAKRGWRDWAGGRLSDGTLWGSGPKGHRCWEYPRRRSSRRHTHSATRSNRHVGHRQGTVLPELHMRGLHEAPLPRDARGCRPSDCAGDHAAECRGSDRRPHRLAARIA